MTGTVTSERYNPCKGCPDRYPACSDHCRKPERVKWLQEQETIRNNRKKYNTPIWTHGDIDPRRNGI